MSIGKIIAFAGLVLIFSDHSLASTQIEELTVSARQRQEPLQQVPLTVSVVSQQTIDLYQLRSVRDLAETVPGLYSSQRGSGSAAALYLRGIGSNTNDAAFDSAVALNFDGLVANNSRLITNGSLDLAQVEVLKGPQSLYFGKGASAGVISVHSADPTDEFESRIKLAREFEEDGLSIEGVVSGALSDSILARLALATNKADRVTFNSDPNAANKWRGEDNREGRLTLVWTPSQNLSANLKYSFSDYQNDGPLLFADVQCRGVSAQSTIYGFAQLVLPNSYDCDFSDQQIQVADQNNVEAQNQTGNNGGIPYADQSLDLFRLQLEWDLSEHYQLISISGYLDMAEQGFDCFAYDSHGSNCVATENSEQSLSQELRIQSSFDGAINFSAGALYQDRDTLHRNHQNVFGLAYLIGSGFGAEAALDPITGNSFDWTKEHPTNHKTYSVFVSVNWQLQENLNMTLGGRYTDEQKQGQYSVPYIHSAFLDPDIPSAPSGFSVTSSFSDSNFNPELSLSYSASEATTYYAAYKTGFKSGGIATSPLPLFTTYLNLAAGDSSELLFDSETSSGFEAGIKTYKFDDRLRLSATIYRYLYENLQVQNFDSGALAFVTLNADEVTNKGIETEFVYQSALAGLIWQGEIAYTDTKYTESFLNILDIDLNGEKRQQAPEWTGKIGFDYRKNTAANLVIGLNLTAQYSDNYLTNNAETGGPDDYVQPSFWLANLAIYLGDQSDQWQLSFSAKNLTDKLYTIDTVGRPNSIPNADGQRDLVHFQNRGRQLSLAASHSF